MSYDLVIQNGTIIDGSGGPAYRSDVGVRDGKIAGFGKIRDAGAQVIDAEGLVVSPGFIDGHTHMDAQIFWDPYGTGSSWHGVTSVVMGNCGFTLAPCRTEDRELLMSTLESVEDIPADAMRAGIEWSWVTYREYLERLDRLPKGINYGGYVGHSALRRYAMGERAATERATPEDIDAMRAELSDALHAGALGFTTSRSPAHITGERKPVPSRTADWDEVRSLVGLMGELNAGIFEIARERSSNSEDVLDFMNRMRDLAVETRVPFMFGVASEQNWLDFLTEVVAAGGRAYGQANSRVTSTVWSFKTHTPFDALPYWRDLHGRPIEEIRKALSDPDLRARLIEVAANPPPRGLLGGAEAKVPTTRGYDFVKVLQQPLEPNPSLGELARARGVHPVEVMIDLSLESDFELLFAQDLFLGGYEGRLATLVHPHTVPTFSDSGAHVSQIVDCSLQSYLLAYWVREREAMTLETAVRKMTFDMASAWGIHNRGLLRTGLAADIIVFDPKTVGPVMPQVASDLPAGAKRLIQKAQGFHTTIVNGTVVYLDGDKPTGDLPGRLILGPLAAAV